MSTASYHQPAAGKTPIVVLGAGVIGLTTALRLQETGKYQVTIVGEFIPSDPKSIKYTSQWAGAHHVYNPFNDTNQHVLEEETFNKMWEMSAPGSDAEECFLRIPQTEYFFCERTRPDPMEKMPEFRDLTKDELVSGSVSGVTFHTVTIDVPIYLNYLLMRFCARGGRVLRGAVLHISQVIEGGTRIFSGGSALDPLPAAVIVCVGLGSRTLGGVEDTNVYPIRGQTVLVRSPWVRFGRTETKDETGALTYIIPRRSSDVIVGGTRAANDWYPRPRPEITQDILTRALALCPELAPPDIRAVRKPTVDDIMHLVVGEGCGLRPARKGGVRLEVEWFDGASVHREGKIPIVHNYGHGGYGYQASWGSATVALQLLEEALQPKSG